MFMQTLLESIFLTVVIFAFHSTKFNEKEIELPVMQKKKYAWLRVYTAYTAIFFIALLVWEITLRKKKYGKPNECYF